MSVKIKGFFVNNVPGLTTEKFCVIVHLLKAVMKTRAHLELFRERSFGARP